MCCIFLSNKSKQDGRISNFDFVVEVFQRQLMPRPMSTNSDHNKLYHLSKPYSTLTWRLVTSLFRLVGFQAIWKIFVKLDHFSPSRDEKKHQLLKPPPRFKIRPELLSVPGSPSPWMTHQGTEIFTTKPCRSTTTSARCNEAWQVPRLNLDDWTNHQWLPWRNFVVFLVGAFKEQKRT